MKVLDYLDIYKPKINETIKKIFNYKLDKVKAPILKGYYSELLDYFLSGGKRLRPLICIASYNAFKKEKDERIIFPSVGIEFLHNASLIHDDIIDRDDFRRNNPAFHYRFRKYHEDHHLKKMDKYHYGTSMGIIGGDFAYFIGLNAFSNNEFNELKNLKAVNYYAEAFYELCDGILIEMDMINRYDLIIDEYIEMISLKTGALIQKSMLIGAMYADAPENALNYLGNYGINVGIIFQIIDDILGTFGDEKVTGKPIDGDIREGKKTCLLIKALQNLDQNKRNELINLVGKNNITQDEINKVRELFKESDAINACMELVNKYKDLAKNQLEQIQQEINQSEFEFYENLLKYVSERSF
ncbi:MAG: polyprenyl synthetase family protein [Candidatus Helarchaeota archaeon]